MSEQTTLEEYGAGDRADRDVNVDDLEERVDEQAEQIAHLIEIVGEVTESVGDLTDAVETDDPHDRDDLEYDRTFH